MNRPFGGGTFHTPTTSQIGDAGRTIVWAGPSIENFWGGATIRITPSAMSEASYEGKDTNSRKKERVLDKLRAFAFEPSRFET